MTAYASDLPDFTDLIRATASALGIPAPIIEKDYYLTRALFFLSRDHAGRFLLKGGTSLTKGWDLLDRFSEDLDLLLKVESEGRPLSKGERERRLKSMCATISGAPGFSTAQGRFPVETGVHRTAEFIYPGSVEDLAWIIHDFAGKKRKDALKGVMNTGFWRTRHSLSEHPRDDILYSKAVLFLLPTPNHSS